MEENSYRSKRQREVSLAGRSVERRIMEIIVQDQFIAQNTLIAHGPSGTIVSQSRVNLRDFRNNEHSITIESELLAVEYKGTDGSNLYLFIDADIVIYSLILKRVVCMISSKKSFRERGAQTAYWAIKKKERSFKYVLATPDVDKELFDLSEPSRIRKWRVILQNEMDAVFVIDKNISFKNGNFYVGNPFPIDYIRSLLY